MARVMLAAKQSARNFLMVRMERTKLAIAREAISAEVENFQSIRNTATHPVLKRMLGDAATAMAAHRLVDALNRRNG